MTILFCENLSLPCDKKSWSNWAGESTRGRVQWRSEKNNLKFETLTSEKLKSGKKIEALEYDAAL